MILKYTLKYTRIIPRSMPKGAREGTGSIPDIFRSVQRQWQPEAPEGTWMPARDMFLCLPSVFISFWVKRCSSHLQGVWFWCMFCFPLYFCCLLNGRDVLHTIKGYVFYMFWGSVTLCCCSSCKKHVLLWRHKDPPSRSTRLLLTAIRKRENAFGHIYIYIYL